MRGFGSEKRSTPPNSLANSRSQRLPSHKTRLALLFNRVFTLTLSAGILGLTASYVSTFKGYEYAVSGQLGYIVACAALTIPASIFLSLANAPTNVQNPRRRGLGKLVQSAIDLLFMVLWIAAASVADGSATGFCTDGKSVAGLAAVMAFFFAWAAVVDLLSDAAK